MEQKSVDEWLTYILDNGSSVEAPSGGIENRVLAHVLQSFAPQEKFAELRHKLAAGVSVLALASTYHRRDESFMALHSSDPDAEVRRYLADRLTLVELVDLNEPLRKGMTEFRMDMWRAVLRLLHDPSWLHFPPGMSDSLQNYIILHRCNQEKQFLGARIKRGALKDAVVMMDPENDFYMNLNRADLCELVANLNMLSRTETHAAIMRCRSKMGAESAHVNNLDRAVRSWQDGQSYYLKCVGEKCSSEELRNLPRLAREVRDLIERCEAPMS